MVKKENYNKLSKLERFALVMIVLKQSTSTAVLQRTFEISFPRAVKIIEKLCECGFITEQDNYGKRKILVTKKECLDLLLTMEDINKEEFNEKIFAKDKFFDGIREFGLDVLKGIGIEQSLNKALTLFKKSAEYGNTFAKETLGVLFCDGEDYGIEKNWKKAYSWFNDAYSDKTGISAFYLGEMYYYGNGVEQNYEKAYKLLTESIDLGCSNGYYLLGKMYESGWNNVPKDLNKAFEMFFEGAKHGGEEEKDYLEKVFCENNKT